MRDVLRIANSQLRQLPKRLSARLLNGNKKSIDTSVGFLRFLLAGVLLLHRENPQ